MSGTVVVGFEHTGGREEDSERAALDAHRLVQAVLADALVGPLEVFNVLAGEIQLHRCVSSVVVRSVDPVVAPWGHVRSPVPVGQAARLRLRFRGPLEPLGQSHLPAELPPPGGLVVLDFLGGLLPLSALPAPLLTLRPAPVVREVGDLGALVARDGRNTNTSLGTGIERLRRRFWGVWQAATGVPLPLQAAPFPLTFQAAAFLPEDFLLDRKSVV